MVSANVLPSLWYLLLSWTSQCFVIIKLLRCHHHHHHHHELKCEAMLGSTSQCFAILGTPHSAQWAVRGGLGIFQLF